MEAAVAQTQSDKASGDTAAFYSIISYFRETNVEGMRILDRLSDAIAQSKADGDHSAAFQAFADTLQVIRKEIVEARLRAAAIQKVRDSDPENHAWYARELVEVENSWDDLDQLWPVPADGAVVSLAALQARGNSSVKVLDNLIFTCACQSIPNELENYLKNYRIGTRLDFVAIFKDQLPDEAATRRVLAALAPQSDVVSGLIDVNSATIVKADQRWWRQVLSVVLVLGTVGLGFGLIYLAIHFRDWFQWSVTDWRVGPDQWAALNGAYVLVLLGVLGHWILDRVKQNQAGTSITPLAEWLMWVHINEVPITVRISTVWLLVALGVAFQTFDFSKGIQPLTYFLAGYFMDSTLDALIGRLNNFISDNDPDKKKALQAAS